MKIKERYIKYILNMERDPFAHKELILLRIRDLRNTMESSIDLYNYKEGEMDYNLASHRYQSAYGIDWRDDWGNVFYVD